jgi:exonuclease SbcC
LFNAQNDAKLDLETFAIGAMFDQVLQAANLRLQPMTSGRYSLEREFDGKGGGRRGLGIRVHDIHTGKARATSTLSGGETFIAALSLALGLARSIKCCKPFKTLLAQIGLSASSRTSSSCKTPSQMVSP